MFGRSPHGRSSFYFFFIIVEVSVRYLGRISFLIVNFTALEVIDAEVLAVKVAVSWGRLDLLLGATVGVNVVNLFLLSFDFIRVGQLLFHILHLDLLSCHDVVVTSRSE